MRKYIASIELDNGLDRGKVFAEMNDDNEYVIMVELPNGDIEEPAISSCETMEQVERYIQAAWGASVWDLQWEES